jgi:hypothetical protein
MTVWTSTVLIAGIVPDEKLNGLGFRRGTLTCACPLVAQVDERNQHRQFILTAVRLRLPDGLCDASKRKPGTRLHAQMGPELNGEAPSSARHYH